MMSFPSDLLVIPGELTDEAIGQRVGRLDVALTDAATGGFTLLDTFDQAIRKDGQMLIETDRRLALYRNGGTLTQGARRRGGFVADLAAGPVKDALGRLSPLRSLLAIGGGTATRRQLSLTDDEGKTHARADLLTLRPEGKGTPVTLAFVQGLRGYDDALQALRDRIGAAPGQDRAAVADIGDLLFPDHVPYEAKPDLAIGADTTAFDVAQKIIAAHLDVARRNEPGIIADHDTEFLHDYRVALRKIRSVVSLFKGVYSDAQTAALKKAFSDLMAPTGPLRDLDVYLLGRDDYYAMLPDSLHPGLGLMFRMLADDRQREHRKLAGWLGSDRYRASLDGLGALLAAPGDLARGPDADRPAHDYACALIWKRYRKACRIAATITDRTPDEQVHELRILCKKLRYLMEFFAPVLPPEDLRLLLRPLKALQENLGLFNDYSVQQVSLRHVMDHHLSGDRSQDLMLAQSVGALIAVLHARQKRERARVKSSFEQFDSPETRSMFRDLFYGKGA
ncbi:CHAD domain-containing protein [Paracoccus sp. (in: a-proteobacteria)]|uniref:CHAD domain-containing protein n=1 Tax=Paracoccus sp. TaxID=267 RepID=UPI0035B13E39